MRAQKALLFVNKKKQKNFISLSLSQWESRRPRITVIEVFWFFFLKKNCFL